jgi:quinoprotein glucose dehydrogenase
MISDNRLAHRSLLHAPSLRPLGLLCNKPLWGDMVAVDLQSETILWRSRVGTTEDRKPFGIAFHWGTPLVNGVGFTAGQSRFQRCGARECPYTRLRLQVEWRALARPVSGAGRCQANYYLRQGAQDVAIGAGGHAESGTRSATVVVPFRLTRPGEGAVTMVAHH